MKSRLDSGSSYTTVVVNKDKKEIGTFKLQLKGGQPKLNEIKENPKLGKAVENLNKPKLDFNKN